MMRDTKCFQKVIKVHVLYKFMEMNFFGFRDFLMLETDEYPNLTFGVEVEVAFAPRVGGWKDEEIQQIINQMKLGWSFGKDQTCQPGIEMKTKPNPITSSVLQALESDLNIFNQNVKNSGFEIVKNPERCATHIHIGGLSEESKIKIAKLWVDGGVQDMGQTMIAPARRKLLDEPSYMRRVSSVNQYQTMAHNIPKTKVGKFVQKLLTWLKNVVSFDKFVGWDKFYSMSPRGGLGTLEFRTKESTTDGHELAILVKSLAAFCSAADMLYNKLQQGSLDTSDVRQAMYSGGVSPKDLGYVMRRASKAG